MKLMRRARPSLGTLVEVAVLHEGDASTAQAAIAAAFERVERVQELMSFHDAQSDVGRINRARPGQVITVDEETWQVLRTAQEISRLSDGLFDITVAPQVERLGFLPKAADALLDADASWRDIELLPHQRVRLWRKLRVDLGGIAKGYAVDRAVAALRDCGITTGRVNAGGDLRAFGQHSEPLQIRHPLRPDALLPLERDFEAVATSAGYYRRCVWEGEWVCPIVNARTRRPCAADRSVTVMGAECMIADALTKVVAASVEASASVLRHFGADALVLESDGQGHACRLLQCVQPASAAVH